MLKLSFLALPDYLFGWINDYLLNRKQCVVVGGQNSPYADVTSGVPQGSVLGPLLFLIYVNDIAQNLTCSVRLYADDCVIYREVKCEDDSLLLQSDLEKVMTWCDKWQMFLNINKCNYIRFTKKKQPYLSKYQLNGVPLQEVADVKYLGVYLSADLSWTKHVDAITAKANRVLNFIKRNFKMAPTNIKELLYVTNVRPILEYACPAWDPYYVNLISKLERVQNRAARFVANNYKFCSSITVLKR